MLSSEKAAEIRKELADNHEDLLFADGFDRAIVGTVERCAFEAVVCYDVEDCITILMEDGLGREEADEHFSFNVLGAYVGPMTPMFLHRPLIEK